MIHLLLQSLCAIIKCQHRWNNCTANGCCLFQILQMNFSKRHFSWYQNYFSSLLQTNISCPLNQVFCIAGYNSGQCFHTAGKNDHSIGHKRPACNDCSKILFSVNIICQTVQHGNLSVTFQIPGQSCALADNQMNLTVILISEHSQQYFTHLYPGGTGYCYNDPHFSVLFSQAFLFWLCHQYICRSFGMQFRFQSVLFRIGIVFEAPGAILAGHFYILFSEIPRIHLLQGFLFCLFFVQITVGFHTFLSTRFL